MNNINLKELFLREDIFYRGFCSKYDVFESKKKQSYTWLTTDAEYALEYAKDNGNIAFIEIKNAAIGDIFDLDENTDLYEPSEEDMETLYKNGLDGYTFYANNNESLCVCIKKDVLQLICCIPTNVFLKYIKER